MSVDFCRSCTLYMTLNNLIFYENLYRLVFCILDNSYSQEKKYIDVGTHILRLYKPPVPDPGELPLSAHPVPPNWVRYGRANVRIYIAQGKPTDDSLPPSDVDTDEEEECPRVIYTQI